MDDRKVNAMSPEMLHDLDAALGCAQSDKAAVVLRSAREGIFSAGFDLKIFAANDPARSLEMVRAGAELALRLMAFPSPTVGVIEGHAFPMGTFLLLACDVRIGALGKFRMGLNEVVIGISPPRFAIELARSRIHPAWLSRTVTLGEMFEPEAAVTAGFLDRAVPPDQVDEALTELLTALKAINVSMHATAKRNLRKHAMAAMREAIDADLTLDAYQVGADRLAIARRSSQTASAPSSKRLARRLNDALGAQRWREVDREIARLLAQSGGRLTDSLEREIMRKVFASDGSLPH
jgi:enoyl-CoA hydratase